MAAEGPRSSQQSMRRSARASSGEQQVWTAGKRNGSVWPQSVGRGGGEDSVVGYRRVDVVAL